MLDFTKVAPHEIQAAIAACRDPGELDSIAERAMERWPDLAKAARRRSAAFKAHASRAGGAVRMPAPRPVRAMPAAPVVIEGSVPFNVFIVSASGISEMQLATRGMALSFAERIQGQLVGTAQAAPVAKKAKVAKPAKAARTHKWLVGGDTLRTPPGGFDWAAYDAAQAEHHALIRAKFGSLAAQEEALKRADRALMQKGGRYNESAALKFRAHMDKAALVPTGVPTAKPTTTTKKAA